MKRFVQWAVVAAFVLVPGVVSAQSVSVRERVLYERQTTYRLPDKVSKFSQARASQPAGEKALPWPYFHFVKANESNLNPEHHDLLQPISSNGVMLCDEDKNAYSLAARQWQGMDEGVAAYDIARALGRLDGWWPCGFKNGLVLSDFHISLRTATEPSRLEPSWILRWTDQFGFYHYSALKASSAVYQRASLQ